MNILNNNDINILDLPDEMLLAIFNKLNMIDLFYSLVDINQRFDRLLLDPLYIHHLDFVIKQGDIHNSLVYTHILNRICSEFLPRINEKVKKLTVDSFSMERILGAVHYPQLYSLSLINYQPEVFRRHLTDKTILHLLDNQITNLTVNIYSENEEIFNENELNIFLFILLISRHLHDMTFLQKCSRKYITIWSLNTSNINCLSSTLTKLTINVNTFDDCLYILNGCLQSLSTLIIRIYQMSRSPSIIDNTKKLLKLKCFSFITDSYTLYYDEQVVPLLRRMLNLDELTLFLSVARTKPTYRDVINNKSIYIDGNQLYDEVLNYMPRLNKFIFSIHTHIENVPFISDYLINNDIKIYVPSNDDLRNSFIQKGFQSIDICADNELINNRANCHVYSLPYQFHEFLFMNNCFQGGKFDKVRLLSMVDKLPFEHELFKIISQDFPFLQQLSINNCAPQQNKQHYSSTLITFNHLFKLHLYCIHNDYVIQFLSEKNTRLPCLTNLIIDYETLTSVTNNFTNNVTRLNCTKIKSLVTYEPRVGSQNFHLYFPSL